MGKDEPKYIPLIGYDSDYVGRSPWDFYSWGHIDMGIGAFLLISLIITVTEWVLGPGSAIVEWWMVLALVILFSLIWEFIENVILWKLGWKFEDRQDSWPNFIWDVIFVILGGGLMWLFKWIIMDSLGYLGR
ncbi:MAG: hypothetical protein ACFFAO_04000 [Candidatus Hermodarchaeota archaeon]